MGSPDRIQIDDHFAAAKRRSSAPPPSTIGFGSAAVLLLLLAGGIAATWWWALQPAASSPTLTGPSPTTVADRQAAVAGQLVDEPRGPLQGGETSEQYRARLARLRASAAGQEDAPDGAARPDATAMPANGAALPADALRPPAATAGTAPTGAPARPAAQAPADGSALHLARLVNEHRQALAGHLRWLDACQTQHLVDNARALISRAKDGDTQHQAMVAAKNLAADIDTHQREVRRIDDLCATTEQRLVDYSAVHGQVLPELDNPPVTADGRRPAPRPLPTPSAPR